MRRRLPSADTRGRAGLAGPWQKDQDVFDYDWFHGTRFEDQRAEARIRCALRRFTELDRDAALDNQEFIEACENLRTRTLVYLRDGFSYELKEIIDVASKAHLTFECEPVDDHYKVGAFVISVPFDDIVRVEVFAVHPDEMPDDMPAITGFRTKSDGQPAN